MEKKTIFPKGCKLRKESGDSIKKWNNILDDIFPLTEEQINQAYKESKKDDWVSATIKYGEINKKIADLYQQKEKQEILRNEIYFMNQKLNKQPEFYSKHPTSIYKSKEEKEQELSDLKTASSEKANKILLQIKNYGKSCPSELLEGIKDKLNSLEKICRKFI